MTRRTVEALALVRVKSLHYLNTGRGETHLRNALQKLLAALDAPTAEPEPEIERARR